MDMKATVANQLRTSRNISLEGKIINHDLGDLLIFVPCNCVQDSPENPCPCGDIRILIDMRDIYGKPSKTKLKSHDGESIYSIDLDRNANVVVESSKPVPAADIEALSIGTAPAIVGLAGAAAGQATLGLLAKQLLELIERLKTDRPVDPPFPDDATPTLLPFLAVVIAAEIAVVGGILAAMTRRKKRCRTTTHTQTLSNGDTFTTTQEVCD